MSVLWKESFAGVPQLGAVFRVKVEGVEVVQRICCVLRVALPADCVVDLVFSDA